MTFSVYRKVFLVYNFDTESRFWTQIRHRMSSRGDISGQYIPENDISGQATRNAFRESPEKSFLVKENFQKKSPEMSLLVKKKSFILNDISGQATRNAFRESPEMSFLLKKNHKIFPEM